MGAREAIGALLSTVGLLGVGYFLAKSIKRKAREIKDEAEAKSAIIGGSIILFASFTLLRHLQSTPLGYSNISLIIAILGLFGTFLAVAGFKRLEEFEDTSGGKKMEVKE